MIISEWLYKVEECGYDSHSSGQRAEDGFCEHGNKISVSTKGWGFVD
jgi:hypothetical protein